MSTEPFNLRLSEDQVDSEPEVELISLITEKLPNYKLRADYSVRFSGYQHSDFYRAEQVREEITELTNDQIHHTLEYFILCGLRVRKMTDTYEDCAALTLLVQEQRSHLDLAANIGLNLVEKNSQLEQRVSSLEEQLETSKETIKQISHQLSLKDELLRMFHNEMEDSEDQNSLQSEPSDHGFHLDKVNVKHLESKLTRLEEENMKLRDQQHTLTNSADLLENKETQLVNDCVSHILESTKTIDRLSQELNKKTNEYLNQHEEISHLLTTKIDLENKTHNLLAENDSLITQLRDHQTKEFTLTKEISDMRDRYDECINLLNEKQDEIRQLKKSLNKETKRQFQYYNSSSPEPDLGRSLAEELEESNKRGADEMVHSRTMRIMEQARCLNTSWMTADDETSSGFTDDFTNSMTTMDVELGATESLSGNFLLRRSIQDDCERRRLLRYDDRKGSGHSGTGTLTPHSPTNKTRSQYMSEAMHHRQNSCNGLSSINSNIISRTESSNSLHGLYKYPDKLQLIKPIEGSQTLRAWQNLATPSITKALFENHPADVCFRGQQFTITSPELSPNLYKSHDLIDRRPRMLSDMDDMDYDEPPPTVRTKHTESHSNTYTFSNSKLSHPINDVTSSSSRSSQHTSEYPLDNISQYSLPASTSNDSTPTNPVSTQSTLSNQYSRALVNPTSSWLDRFTVSSIMTSILGFSKPANSGIFVTGASQSNITSSTSTQSPIETSLIGRLTNLPPLAKRKSHNQRQIGLNLLTSIGASSSLTQEAIYRQCRGPKVEDPYSDPLGQVD